MPRRKNDHSSQTKQSHFFEFIIASLFHLLLLVTPFVFTWVNEELFEFPKMLIVYTFTLIITAVWASRMIVEEKIIFKRSKLDWVLAAFFLSQVLATIFSMHIPTSIFGYYTRFHGGLLSTISYILLYYAFISNVSFRHLKGFVITILLAATGSSLYAFPEHFGHSPSCFFLSGGSSFDVSCWVQDVQNRVFGTFGQPNWLAAFVIMVLPISIVLFSSSIISDIFTKKDSDQKNPLQFAFDTGLFVLSSLLFAVLLFTKSRSGFLGFSFSMILICITIGYLLYKNAIITSKKTFFTKFSLVIISIVILSINIGTPFSPSIGTILKNNSAPSNEIENSSDTSSALNRLEVGGSSSGEIRKIVWQGAIDIWKRYPVFGSGVETFAYSYYFDRPAEHNLVSEWDFLYNKAHNELLNILATTGITGLVTYLSLLGYFFFLAGKYILSLTHKKNPTGINTDQRFGSLLVISLCGSVTGLFISNFFGFSTVVVSMVLFIFFAWFEIIYRSTQTDSKSTHSKNKQTKPSIHKNENSIHNDYPSTNKHSLTTNDYISLTVIGVTTLYLLFIIFNFWKADTLYALGNQLLKEDQLITGAQVIEKAITKSPQALYFDKLSLAHAQIAVGLNEINETTSAAQFAEQAIHTSDIALQKNPVHLNFYKTRARVFLQLSLIDPQYLQQALDTLQAAQEKAPTDVKISYHRALILSEMDHDSDAITLLEEVITLKPNYAAARAKLAEIFEQQGKYEEAKKQYEYILTNITPEDPITAQKLQNLEKKILEQNQ